MNRRIGAGLALMGLALVGSATLFPHPGDAYQTALTPFWCLVCGELGAVDVLLNVVLFVPYGMGLRWAGLSRRRSLALVALTTLLIEGLQFKLIAGRDASLSDLLTNTMGGAIGILLADHWRLATFPRSATSRRLGRIGAAAWPALWCLCGWSLGLALPRTTWWGQWAPELGQFEHFPG
ncbi:MAG: VanZ family protein, partial [Gemmatimonadales bacterium]